MPWFRFIGEDGARVTLPFRNGAIECVFANLGGEEGWAWVAQKKDRPHEHVVLVRCANVMALGHALTAEGFSVEGGSTAERIMRAAVRCGHAEELPEDRRWRRELIRAKGRRPSA